MPTAPDAGNGTAASSPGSSSPGDPGYEGRVTVGDEGAAADPESFEDPFGRPTTSGGSAPERPPDAPGAPSARSSSDPTGEASDRPSEVDS